MKKVMVCHAFVVHLFTKKFMLHIWLRPYKRLGWHRKRDGLIGRLLWIEKFN